MDSQSDQKSQIAERALKVIESIAIEDDGPLSKEDRNRIFRMAHAGRSPSCSHKHPEWAKDLNRTYLALI